MGIFDRIKNIIKANVNDVPNGRSFDDLLNESDEELKRIINDLNQPRPQPKNNSGSRQQTKAPPRQSQQSNVVYRAYQVLGLRPTASIDEIKSSYRKLMREFHPDKVSSASKEKQDEAKKHAQEINLAYEILGKVRGF